MKLSDVHARLSSWAESPLKAIGAAGDIKTAMEQSRGAPATPAAYLLPIGDTGGPNRLAMPAVNQQVTMNFGVALVVRDVSDAKGGKAVDALEDVYLALRYRLVGWSPSDDIDLVEFASGGLVAFVNGTVWWLERYRTSFQLRVT